MTRVNKTIAALTLFAVFAIGASSAKANGGILINSATDTSACTETTVDSGILINSLTGILINSLTGILINSATPTECVNVDSGILINS